MVGNEDRRYPLVEVWDEKFKTYVWQQTDPPACPNGHPWNKPFTMRRGHETCSRHGGHYWWRCATKGCDGEIVDPPHDGAIEPERWQPGGV